MMRDEYFFEILGLDENFDLDMNILEEQYLKLISKYNPDFAISFRDKIGYIDLSSKINEAYKSLKSDYSRASHMLKIRGIDVEDENKTRGALDENFYNQIFVLNEELGDLKIFEELDLFMKKVTKERKNLTKAISDGFKNDNIENVMLITLKLKYYDNLISLTENKISKCF